MGGAPIDLRWNGVGAGQLNRFVGELKPPVGLFGKKRKARVQVRTEVDEGRACDAQDALCELSSRISALWRMRC